MIKTSIPLESFRDDPFAKLDQLQDAVFLNIRNGYVLDGVTGSSPKITNKDRRCWKIFQLFLLEFANLRVLRAFAPYVPRFLRD